jgi:hypothetical protein
LFRVLVKEREQLSSGNVGGLESKIGPQVVEKALVEVYAQELANLFPRLIKRAGAMALLPTSVAPSERVQFYLREASKCFVYGRFVASLILCRVALEEGIRDLLKRLGLQADFAGFSALKGEGDLARMIRFGENRPIHGVLWGTATMVRQKANPAAHGTAPTAEDCRICFENTRSLLKQLYSVRAQ